jgi:hypothetical protein
VSALACCGIEHADARGLGRHLRETHTARTDCERAIDYFRLFDQLAEFAHSITTMFESCSHGATAALKSWADARGYELIDMWIPDAPVPTRVLHCDCPSGANVSVQRAG